jgi:hypothetical protein
MRKRLLVALGGLFGLVAIASLPFVLPNKSTLEVKYDRVRPSMTREEAESILGKPYATIVEDGGTG